MIPTAVRARRIQQIMSSNDIRIYKTLAVNDRTINMCLRREIDDRIKSLGREQIQNKLSIRNVAAHKAKTTVIRQRVQIFQISGICEFIKDKNPILRIFSEMIMGVIRSDKPGPA